MKKIAFFIAAFAFILVLTKIANDMPPEQPSGISFWLKSQKVIECTPEEITLVDHRNRATHLIKDLSWPPCESFTPNQPIDFYLARGERTHFISMEKSSWWRSNF